MPLSINQIPIPVPSSTDPVNFSARGDAVFGAFPNFITQTNAVASEAAANRDSAEASKVAAANSETNAATYAANATTSANNASSSSTAPLWVSGTTYAVNDKRVSPVTGQVYRRKVAGAGTTDPSLDSTNWYAVLLDADTQYPSINPTLNLDFANSGKLDPRITFTRASTATYYDGKTFAKAEENLLTYSQEFDNAVWVKTRTAVTANATTAPDGTTTADKLIEDTSTNTHFAYQVFNATATTNAVSFYAKAAERSWCYVMGDSVSIFAYFNLATGTVGSTSGITSATITSVGNGWYRCTIIRTFAAGEKYPGIGIATADNGSNYTGDGTSGIYIWGAQLEQRPSVTAYTPTTSQPITKYQPVLKTAANNEPRFDYDPVTLEAKGLLIEESRQNLALWNRDLTNAAWVKTNCSVLKNQAGLDGVVEASTVTASAANATILQSISSASNTRITSAYIKRVSGTGTIQMTQNNGGTWTDITSSLTTSWKRFEVPSASFSNPTIGFRIASNADAIAVDFVQHELGSFSTSAIATTTTAVTRQADSAVMTGTNFTSWYNLQGGSVYMEADTFTTSSSFACLFSINDGTTSNTIEANAGGANAYFQVKNSALQADLNLGNFQVNKFSKIAVKFAFNDFAACQDSGAVQVDTSGTLPAVTRLDFGNAGSIFGNPKLNGHIRKFAYYPRLPQNSQLQILTK